MRKVMWHLIFKIMIIISVPTEQKQNGDHITRNFTKISTTGNVNLGNDALFENSDSIQFREFMKTIPLTGDKDVDEEILNFYRLKFQN